ncbi:MAG: pyridoxal phosphate-dependent aminotransferase [Bacteroidota bacterium]
MRVSNMAENLIGSEIIKLGGEIRDRILQGEHIYNFTIGDFNPKIFPIPAALKADILEAYENDLTNYPIANGAVELRKAVVKLLKEKQDLNYDPEEILVAGGARPIIYAIFQAIVDPGDKVLFPVPSWNNNHYTHLSHANQVFVETLPEENFMPNADVLRDHVKGASLLALCSPLNPTGTVFSKEQLESICDLVLEENASRGENEKPLYVMYDQIYSLLTFGDTQHFDPVSLRPEMRKYTVYVDGISKSLAATGVRVGWGFGPAFIIDKMKSILGHVGAWAPRPEQMASGKYLDNIAQVDAYLSWIKEELQTRLNGFYQGITRLKDAGYPVQAIPPAAAIYLTVQFNLIGKKMANGDVLQTTGDVTAYLLNEAKVALVPFRAFGASDDSTWYRLSVGTASTSDVEASILAIESAMAKLV